MGHCVYIFNPSEIYKRTKPGQGVETMCGALTFPAVDDPEIVPVRLPNPGSAEAVYGYLPTGNYLPRSQHDPYCPEHGGSPEPAPPPVSYAELMGAREAYLQLAERFERDQAEGMIAGSPLGIGAGPDPEPGVSADQLAQAGQLLAELAARAAEEAGQ